MLLKVLFRAWRRKRDPRSEAAVRSGFCLAAAPVQVGEDSAPGAWLQAICDALEQPLYVLDHGHHLVLANRSCRKFYGLHPEAGLDELTARLRGTDELGHLGVVIRQLAADPDRSLVTPVPAPGAAEADHKIYAAPLRDAAGRVQGRVVLIQDLTWERRFARQLEQEVREATVGLQEAVDRQKDLDRAKNAFIANMSHELRTPLNHIVTFASSLSDGIFGDLADPQREAVDKVLAGAERLRDLINDVLDYSRLEARRVDLSASEVSVRELVDNALEFVRGPATLKEIELSADLPAMLPMIWGELGKLHQVLTNLLVNALKFTPKGGQVWLTAELEGEALRLGVHDTGIGIDSQHHARLFERFYQVDDSYTREFGGTGLGLAICRQLIELHGGRIEVESQVGVGSHFYVLLPCDPASRISSTLTMPPGGSPA